MKKTEIINSLISALGAIICISFIAYLDKYFDGAIWLIPPFGATMVLVMAVHSSPLAQPKNIILGHILSALSGVIVLFLIGDSFLTLGIAVGLSVFVMMVTKTIHPPAGANPIIVILTGAGIEFVFMPVALGSIIIVIFAVVYNRLMKRDYPFNG
tara:strand:- start:310 stop:774 length:465 start_codon:yes stop_codon:yes gene_type:complete